MDGERTDGSIWSAAETEMNNEDEAETPEAAAANPLESYMDTPSFRCRREELTMLSAGETSRSLLPRNSCVTERIFEQSQSLNERPASDARVAIRFTSASFSVPPARPASKT